MRLLSALLILALAINSNAKAPAELAIIIDDVGYNRVLGERTARLPGAYTLAVLPHTPHSQHLAILGHSLGKEIMLHAPMASSGGNALGPGALTADMARTEFASSLQASIDHIPYVQGVNNHMGSALTRELTPMIWTMGILGRRQLYFIDSRTTAESLAYDTARANGLATAKRDVFLDHVKEHQAIETQLKKAVALARKNGRAIAIGHPYPETLAVLEEATEWLSSQHIVLVPASQLVSVSAPDDGACPAPPLLLRQFSGHFFSPNPSNLEQYLPQLIEFGYQRLFSLEKDGINNSG